jgi:hypothetical protein
VNDEYHLDGDGVAMVFRCKLLGGSGRRSSHYSCDMADVASAASFPVTVADYMRECRMMLKLLQLRGIVNHGASAQDVLDTDAIPYVPADTLRKDQEAHAQSRASIPGYTHAIRDQDHHVHSASADLYRTTHRMTPALTLR